MSNALAIANVTATIQGVVFSESGVKVTAQAPDQAAQGVGGGKRVNVFLFHTLPNAAWRNADMIGQVRPGDSGFPPLALNLHYLLTAYGTDGENGDLDAQQVLGEAMRVLHDRPTLSRDEIRNFAQGQLSNTDLDQQIEQIRITHDPLSHEDLFRMWSTFNAPYRVSAVYQVSVVLIDSRRPTKAPLPVLKRGEADRGVLTRLDNDPTLTSVQYRSNLDAPAFPAANVSGQVLLFGTDLPASGVEIIVRDPQREQIIERQSGDVVATITNVEQIAKDTLRVSLPDGDQNRWTSGMLTMEMRFPMAAGNSSAPQKRTTNVLPLAVAPRLRFQSDVNGKVLINRTEQDGKRLLHLTTEESIEKSRRVFLILSEVVPESDNPPDDVIAKLRSYQIQQDSDSGPFSPKFDVSDVERGSYRLRLRVDVVDSIGFLESQAGGFVFDDRFIVEVP